MHSTVSGKAVNSEVIYKNATPEIKRKMVLAEGLGLRSSQQELLGLRPGLERDPA